jgi:hypothetical protein
MEAAELSTMDVDELQDDVTRRARLRALLMAEALRRRAAALADRERLETEALAERERLRAAALLRLSVAKLRHKQPMMLSELREKRT